MKQLLTNKSPYCCFYTDDGEFTGVVVGGKKNYELEKAKEYFKKNFKKIKEEIGEFWGREITLNDFKEPILETIEFDDYEENYRITRTRVFSQSLQECWYFRIL